MSLKPYDIAPEITFPCAVADLLGNSVVTDDPFDLAEGQIGVLSVDSGSSFWYRPFRLDDNDPVPDPIRIPIGLARWTPMTPSIADGTEDTFTLPETAEGDVVPYRNGRAASGDYTVIDNDTVVFDVPPVAGTRMDALYGVDSILGPYVTSFNGRPNAVTPEAGDYTQVQITPATPKDIAVAAYLVATSDRILNVTYTNTGDATITVATAVVAIPGLVLEIFNAGNSGTVTIEGEAGELINGQSSYVLGSQYAGVRLTMLGTSMVGAEASTSTLKTAYDAGDGSITGITDAKPVDLVDDDSTTILRVNKTEVFCNRNLRFFDATLQANIIDFISGGLTDGLRPSSAYSGVLPLTANVDHWDDFVDNFGNVALLDAINKNKGVKQTISASTGTVQFDKDVIHIDYTTTGAVTVTIPTARFSTNHLIEFHDIDANAATNNITIVGEGGEPINGDTGGVVIQTNGVGGGGASLSLRMMGSAALGARIVGGSL